LLDAAVGPIWVEGAEKGDALEVEILDIQTCDWGWSTTENLFGLIKGRFPDNLVMWSLNSGFAESRSSFLKGVKVPLRPFLGVMGVAPDEGEYGMIAPQSFGGNMDNKLLTAGAKLFLPIMTRGALFSVADPHAAQGDGESGGTGIETTALARLRLSVLKNMSLKFPRALVIQSSSEALMVAMGISNDLYKASQFAMENLIDYLEERGIAPAEAYTLCSLVGDLRISELVDEPNHVVSMTFPISVANRK